MVDLAWPNDLGSGTAVWQYFRMGADNWDADRDPQLKSAHETIVEFTPDLTQVVRYEGEMGKASIEPMISRGIIDAQGKLCTMLEDGSPGPEGVVLPATDSETITPRNWTYRATITKNRVRVREFSFPVPAGEDVDLADYIEIVSSGGTHIVTEVETAERSESAAKDAEKYRNETRTDRNAVQSLRNETETLRDEARTAHTGAKSAATTAGEILEANQALGITVDTSVGKAVYVGDTLIHYDSGWHKIESYIPPEVPLHDDFSPSVYIKRENSTVWVSFDIFRVATTIPANAPVLYIPQGFEPYSPARLGSGSTYELRSAIYTSGNELRVRDDVAGGSRRFYVSWSTGSTLPPALP